MTQSHNRNGGRSSLVADVHHATQDAELLARLRELYAEVDRAVEANGPNCQACGRCCRFAEMGHRLYVTTGELALLTLEIPPADGQRGPLTCAYQLGTRCGARERRPLGCRIFFCGPANDLSQAERYEDFHRRIQTLHQTRCTPYAYVELASAVTQLFV